MGVEQEFGDQVRFIGVPGLSDVDSMRQFVADTGTAGFDHIADEDGEVWSRFEITSQRVYVYINDDGSWRRSGYGSLREDVEGLIAQ